MDLESIKLFQMVRKRMNWLTQRQEVLSQNIANADTPGYTPKDLKRFQFREILRREGMQLNMQTTGEGHLGGRRKRIRDFATEENRRPFETSPDGNAVVLEEQAAKINETSLQHSLTTQIYKKQIQMFKTAIGKK